MEKENEKKNTLTTGKSSCFEKQKNCRKKQQKPI